MVAAAATEDLMTAQRLAPLILIDDERAVLQSLTMRRKTAQALALRARIVLACAEGGQNKEVAAKLGLESLKSPRSGEPGARSDGPQPKNSMTP